jgi:hypothetical protein
VAAQGAAYGAVTDVAQTSRLCVAETPWSCNKNRLISDGSGARPARRSLCTLGGELAVVGQSLLTVAGQIMLAANSSPLCRPAATPTRAAAARTLGLMRPRKFPGPRRAFAAVQMVPEGGVARRPLALAAALMDMRSLTFAPWQIRQRR